MSLKILQTCDRCSSTRELNVGYYGGRNTIDQAALTGGWREVGGFSHLCNVCIRSVLNEKEEK